MHQQEVWNLIFLLFGEHLARAEVQEDQAHTSQERSIQVSRTWMKEGMTIWENWCLQRKRERNNQGKKDPRNCEGNGQGRDPGTQVRNRQGEDPRTLEKAAKVGTSVLAQHTARKKDPTTSEAPIKRWCAQKE